jgi:GH24 family phage-related lysozyme (muramidase)
MDKATALIARHEGLRLKSYRCSAGTEIVKDVTGAIDGIKSLVKKWAAPKGKFANE